MEVKSLGNLSTVQQNFLSKDTEKASSKEIQQGSMIVESRNYMEEEKITKEQVNEKIKAMNELVDIQFTSIKFELHEQLDRYIVQVVNRDTEEVVKEIPPKEFLDMISSMLEFAGIIIDKKI